MQVTKSEKKKKKRKRKKPIELVYLLQISNLGTRKTIKKNDWSHFMLSDLISQISQVPKGKNFLEKLDRADLVDWASLFGIKLNFYIAKKGSTALGSHTFKKLANKALAYYKTIYLMSH